MIRLLQQRVALASGNANNSGKAGVFCVNSNHDSTNDNANIGTHLSLFSFVRSCKSLASWQNTKQSLTQFGRFNLEKLEVK